MNVEYGETFIVLDGKGKVISIENGKIKYKDISEIKTINDVFTFWSCNISDLKEYIEYFSRYNLENPLEELNIDELSMLGIKIEEDEIILY